jgi:Xaa-Pro aminopeptidase
MSTDRLARVRALLKKRECTHILVTDSVDVEYLSGFRSSNAYLLIASRTAILFTDFRYQSQAAAFAAGNRRWRFIRIAESDFSFVAEHAPAGSVIGVQSNTLSMDAFDTLKRKCRKRKFVKLGAALSRIPMVKNEREIQAMRRAAAIGDRALAAFLWQIRPGITEAAAARKLEQLCSQFGSERPSFETIVLFGARAALPHGQPSQVRLKAGDWVLCDFGCTFKGLCSDMTRTFVVGTASDEQRAIYDIVFRAQKRARSACRAKMRAAELDAAARSVIQDSGYGEAFGHATGHGLGLRIHEAPRIGSRDETVLRENMVVTIEPGIYLEGSHGIRLEDMVVVGRSGSTLLTRSPRKLLEIPLQ